MALTHIKGRNDIPIESVESGYLFEHDTTADVSLIFGPPNKDGDAPCLLARFHNSPTNFAMGSQNQNELFKDCLSRCENGGFERRRSGGSSGLVRYDKHLMRCLAVKGIFPRDARSIKLIQRDTVWECLYMSPFDAKNKDKVPKSVMWNRKHSNVPCNPAHPFVPVSVNYSPPVLGGKFKVDADIVEKFPFFYWFAEAKLLTAHILHYLQANGDIKYSVANEGCAKEMDHLAFAIDNFERGRLCSQSSHQQLTRRQHILLGVMQCNTFTMVTHPVGYHRDTFGGSMGNQKPSLENKTTFVNTSFQHSIGRGGNGDQFTFAILDW